MGRELAKVPENWEHPKSMRAWGKVDYHPMFRRSYAEALKEWQEDKAKWDRGEFPDYADADSKLLSYEEWAGEAPDIEYYAPFNEDECTWYQVWETVSEGTPVTPPFATQQELIEYLVAKGDFWDQQRGDAPWSRESATNFVMGSGWAPSLVIDNGNFVE